MLLIHRASAQTACLSCVAKPIFCTSADCGQRLTSDTGRHSSNWYGAGRRFLILTVSFSKSRPWFLYNRLPPAWTIARSQRWKRLYYKHAVQKKTATIYVDAVKATLVERLAWSWTNGRLLTRSVINDAKCLGPVSYHGYHHDPAVQSALGTLDTGPSPTITAH